MQPGKTGVLIANLGTPEQPTPKAVKAFLGQFLHDQRVVDLTRWLWCPILHGIILPIRSPKVAKLYQSIWLDDGSPLMVYSQRQKVKLEKQLDIPVELAMTYGSPSVEQGMKRLAEKGVESVVVLPLYPQYSASTTGSVFDALAKVLSKQRVIPNIHFVRDYHDHPLYIRALAQSVRESWRLNGQGDYLLCSYHGIPQRYADNGDIYPLHCERTTELLAKELGLGSDKIGHTYQSRFGREEWLQPYTDKTLEALPSKGVKKLDVISPAFSVDCLETLEEIAQQGKESFIAAGGDDYHFIPCLNDNEAHIKLMEHIVKTALV
ncbi:ferrochelatase [Vibrio viridaestus]|uniref:Ferrochelatase n=1 Tax=Vibrio viridaestus TaxID=2487322 RepID=A0A3N9TFJ1_9VIBR|nr:ferrochelatase [Vibrio viridaestus]RQW62493.1 ferrochelatase [Vibrio viridaestus]